MRILVKPALHHLDKNTTFTGPAYQHSAYPAGNSVKTMIQTSVRSRSVKWNISVPAEFDASVRAFLAFEGGKKGSLSRLVQKAVSRYIVESITRDAKENVRASGLTQEALDKIIADGITRAKKQTR